MIFLSIVIKCTTNTNINLSDCDLKDKDMIGLNIDHSARISESPPSMIAKVEHL